MGGLQGHQLRVLWNVPVGTRGRRVAGPKVPSVLPRMYGTLRVAKAARGEDRSPGPFLLNATFERA